MTPRTREVAVWLSTLHGSKGLEFDAVFISGAEDGIIPMYRDGRADIDEERRLLYVGMTRAKRFLTITYRFLRQRASAKKSGDDRVNRVGSPSPFLANVTQLVKEEEWSTSNAEYGRSTRRR